MYRLSAEKRERGTRGERDRKRKGNPLISNLWLLGKRGAKLSELLFFPSFCRLCHRLLDQLGERVICRPCWQRIHPPNLPACSTCGRYGEIKTGQDVCFNCQQEKWSFSFHRSCALYQGEIKEIILLFKYARIKFLGKDLANLALSFLANSFLWEGLDLVVPVPLYPKRKKERGFNQAEELARHICRAKKIPLAPRALIKIKDNLPQASLEAKERRQNVKGVYELIQKDQIKDKTILLVDDVFTTGSTLNECSLILKKAGAREVRALTIAQA
ncbi:MAG: ComF family protein [Candidatus Aminicenantes bacterium]|nr:ComF family protein [Candidatus Aminicenantes bacterium]